MNTECARDFLIAWGKKANKEIGNQRTGFKSDISNIRFNPLKGQVISRRTGCTKSELHNWNHRPVFTNLESFMMPTLESRKRGKGGEQEPFEPPNGQCTLM